MMGLSYPWVLALAPLPLLVRVLLPAARAQGALSVPDSVIAHLQHHSTSRSTPETGRAGNMVLKTVGWLALMIALAGPFAERPSVLSPTGRDIIVAFDLSASMAEKDMTIDGEHLTRIDVVREKLGAFVRGRRGDRITLIGFATDAFLIAPPTHDVAAVAEMLGEVTIGLPGRKTDLGQAIGLTVKLLRDAPPGDRMLILISDGEVNAGQIAATDAAELARDLGIRIFSIGFAEEIDAANAAHLMDLAERTGGAFHRATTAALMQETLAALNALAPVVPEETAAQRRQDWRWLPLLVALSCLCAVGWREYDDP